MKTLRAIVMLLLTLLMPAPSFSQESFESQLSRVSKEIEVKQNEVRARLAASEAAAQVQIASDHIAPELAKQLVDTLLMSPRSVKSDTNGVVSYKLEKTSKLAANEGYPHILAQWTRCTQKDGTMGLCENSFVPIMVWFTYSAKEKRAVGSKTVSATISIGLWDNGDIRFKAAEYDTNDSKPHPSLPHQDSVVSFFEGAVRQLIQN